MSTEKNMAAPETLNLDMSTVSLADPVSLAAPVPKMVKIRLFKDNGKYSGDVFVGLNGKGFKIKRGVEVEVPEGVAEILEHSQNQDAKTMERIEAVRQM